MKHPIALGHAVSNSHKMLLLGANSVAVFLHKKAGSGFWNAE